MNKYSFSAVMNAFYENSLRETFYIPANAWPDDAVDVSDKTANVYMTTDIPVGKQLGNIDGMPAWIDIPPGTQEELIAEAEAQKTQLRTTADSEITWRQDAVDTGIATEAETASLAEWKKYRVLLMRVDTADPDWPTPPGQQAS
ncbi:tail fiber assembly protein [Escherichia coli]|nr:tail fiber assembly protein [Escherichia coli]